MILWISGSQLGGSGLVFGTVEVIWQLGVESFEDSTELNIQGIMSTHHLMSGASVGMDRIPGGGWASLFM